MKKIFLRVTFLFLIFLVFLIFLTGCVPVDKKCSTDEDCVPASCCHASEAVNKGYAPDCRGVLCSAVCEPGTMDCGQGKVGCVEGKCEVVWKE